MWNELLERGALQSGHASRCRGWRKGQRKQQEDYRMKAPSKLSERQFPGREFSMTGQAPRQTHVERIASLFPLPHYGGWAVICGAIFLITSAVMLFFERSSAYLIPCFLLSALMLAQSTMITWAQGKIRIFKENILEVVDLPREETAAWYENQKNKIFDDKNMILSGILLNVMTLAIGLGDFGFYLQSFYSYIAIKILYFFAHYFVGVGAYLLISTALMLHSIGKLPLNVNMILSENIKPKGILYSEFTICAAAVYFGWGIFYMSTPNRLQSLPSILWFCSFALLLISSFIFPQYSIHQMMIRTKSDVLESFSMRLKDEADDAFLNPNKEKVATLSDMLAVKHQLDELCQWPFGSYELIHIALIVVIPLLVVILEIVFKVIDEG
jgi:hypothetical protein